MHIYLTYQIPLPEEDGIFFYSSNSYSLERVVTKWMECAKESIDIECYMITDKKWIAQLINKARQGINIHIYHHYDHPLSLKGLHENIIVTPSKRKSLMHKKLIMVDKKLCLIGSTNLTQASLLMHDNMMIGIHSKEIGAAIASHVDYFSHHHLQLFNLPSSASLFVKKIIEEINMAKKQITVCMFCLSEKKIISSLCRAIERGVSVDLFIDGHTYQYPWKEIPTMVKIIKNKNLMHHKFALIDDHMLIFGSANWTKNGLSKNEEYGVMIKNPDLLLINQFKQTIKKINQN
ncbi:MAG: hypothetical protein HY860_02075 [Chlamydiales bacterium]|nr:hypothetical protein [Chlamydiales bacterium]